MRKLVLLFVFCAVCASCSTTPDYKDNKGRDIYCPMDELPDLVKCLPSPPEEGSLAFEYDKARYEWGKTMRGDSLRAAIAARDAQWQFDTLVAIFSEPFGHKISSEATPQIYKLASWGLNSIRAIRVQPKAYYKRIRPFMYFNEHMFTSWEEEDLRDNGSYPSGHTISGWGLALLLAEINPDAAEAIFARAWAYGESRVIVGAHWQSDVDASRPAASIAYSYLQNSSHFRRQMAKAKREFKRICK